MTKKVNDYVLTGKYVQPCVKECIEKPNIELDSDHCILIKKKVKNYQKES